MSWSYLVAFRFTIVVYERVLEIYVPVVALDVVCRLVGMSPFVPFMWPVGISG